MEPLPAKFEILPLVTVMSPATKSVVDSLVVKVRAIEESFVVDPDVTVELVIVTVGGVLS